MAIKIKYHDLQADASMKVNIKHIKISMHNMGFQQGCPATAIEMRFTVQRRHVGDGNKLFARDAAK